jgi:hypothetical protein
VRWFDWKVPVRSFTAQRRGDLLPSFKNRPIQRGSSRRVTCQWVRPVRQQQAHDFGMSANRGTMQGGQTSRRWVVGVSAMLQQ